ncbi:MAG TPA: TldD/PmbA family protein [Thermoplasmata archaeon]|nr:TldD/PmbA family protein [Thermoplasmata archaeon]
MSPSSRTADTAFRVADRIKSPEPWEVYAESSRRFEIHLGGRSVEMIRGPIALEGYGIRVLRPHNGSTGSGFQASTDLTDAGIRAALEDAETVARFSEFPAKKVELPGRAPSPGDRAEILDRRLWDDPLKAVEAHIAALLSGFEGRKEIVPSFGSVRATLSETTIANSSGLRTSYAHTLVDLEVAVKAFGGPEGAPPGEYWVNSSSRRFDTERLPTEVEAWCTYAKDVRRAVPPPSGDLPVLLPAGVLAGILPAVVGYRFTGAARLRKIAPNVGDAAAAESVTLQDDGLRAWAPSSSPVDAEGAVRGGRPLIAAGKVSGLLYDASHAAAFDVASTASATRGSDPNGFFDWRRFLHSPRVTSSTIAIAAGDGGSDAELIEAAGDGVWVQQLGWAVPDAISGAFGGEIRIGYRVRNGKLAEPVRGGTVGGVVLAPPGRPSLLQNVAEIGSTVTLAESVASPTLLVRPLVVAGAAGASAPTSKPKGAGRGSSGTSGTARRGRSRSTSR